MVGETPEHEMLRSLWLDGWAAIGLGLREERFAHCWGHRLLKALSSGRAVDCKVSVVLHHHLVRALHLVGNDVLAAAGTREDKRA